MSSSCHYWVVKQSKVSANYTLNSTVITSNVTSNKMIYKNAVLTSFEQLARSLFGKTDWKKKTVKFVGTWTKI